MLADARRRRPPRPPPRRRPHRPRRRRRPPATAAARDTRRRRRRRGTRRRSERRAATACLPPTCISTARPPGPSMHSSHFSRARRAAPRRSTCSATCSKSGSATTTTIPTTPAPARASQALTASGVAVYAMHGNRDFLLGEAFARRTGVKLLPDPVLVDLYGVPTLLSHGDVFCTEDPAYQAAAQHRAPARAGSGDSCRCRSPARRALASAARAGSKAHTERTIPTIMDVNPEAVTARLARHRRAAADPRPHASPGRASLRGRRRELRNAWCSRRGTRRRAAWRCDADGVQRGHSALTRGQTRFRNRMPAAGRSGSGARCREWWRAPPRAWR